MLVCECVPRGDCAVREQLASFNSPPSTRILGIKLRPEALTETAFTSGPHSLTFKMRIIALFAAAVIITRNK